MLHKIILLISYFKNNNIKYSLYLLQIIGFIDK